MNTSKTVFVDFARNSKRLLLISGAICSGKSTLSRLLIKNHNFGCISSSNYLRLAAIQRGLGEDRRQLQELGDTFDIETDYRWVVSPVTTDALVSDLDRTNWLFDAVRKRQQLTHFRAELGTFIRHIHLSAPESILRKRFIGRKNNESLPYEEVVAHQNEISARSLSDDADICFDTSQLATSEIAISIINLWDR